MCADSDKEGSSKQVMSEEKLWELKNIKNVGNWHLSNVHEYIFRRINEKIEMEFDLTMIQ